MKHARTNKEQPKDADAKRRRISVDEEGKPLLKDNTQKSSPPNYKTTRLDEEVKKSEK